MARRAVQAGVVSADVAALSEGVLKMMALSKLKVVTAAVLVGGIAVIGAGGLAYQTRALRADEPADSKTGDQPAGIAQPGQGGGGSQQPKIAASAKAAFFARDSTRIELASRLYEEMVKRNETMVGSPFPEDAPMWSRRWMEDEVRVARNHAERVAATENHLARTKRLEETAENYAKAGQAPHVTALKMRYFRLEAEQLLAEAQAAYHGDPPQRKARNEIR